jgi:hypothetical protein
MTHRLTSARIAALMRLAAVHAVALIRKCRTK